MEVLTVLIRQVIIMFILMAIGYVAFKKELISDQGTKDIGKILLNIVLPVVVISNFWIEKTPEKVNDLIYSVIICILCMVTAIIVSVILFHKNDRIGEFAAAFSNAGFIGIPLVTATFGSNSVFYISMLIVLISLLQWTYGVYTITDDKSVINIKKVITNPVLISVLIGIVLFTLEIPMPKMVSSIFTSISGLNTPLAMFSCGVYLAKSNLLSMLKKKNVYMVSAVRLLLIPFITMLLLKVLPFGNEEMKLAILCAAACPVGSNVSIFAQQYDRDYTKAVEYVCVSTILCLITLPLIIFLATHFI